jgi:hypothetical protein
MDEFEINLELYFDNGSGKKKVSLDETAHDEIAMTFFSWSRSQFSDPNAKISAYRKFKGVEGEILVLEKVEFPGKVNEWIEGFYSATDPIEFFNSGESDVNEVRSTTMRFGNDQKFLLGYKRIFPTSFLHHKRQYWIIPDNTTFHPFKNPLFGVTQGCDVIYYNDRLYCFNYGVLEKFLGFDAVISDKADKSKQKILAQAYLHPDCDSRLNQKKFDRKLSKIPENAIVFSLPAAKVIAFAAKKFQLKIKDGKIDLKSESDVKKFLHVMNDELLKSELTDAEYLAAEKDDYTSAVLPAD